MMMTVMIILMIWIFYCMTKLVSSLTHSVISANLSLSCCGLVLVMAFMGSTGSYTCTQSAARESETKICLRYFDKIIFPSPSQCLTNDMLYPLKMRDGIIKEAVK